MQTMWKILLRTGLSLLLFDCGSFAADTAALFGAITDPSGSVVAGVNVQVQNALTGLSERAATTSSGEYRFPALPVGTYLLKASAAGFKTAVSSNVLLQVNEQVRLDITLTLGDTSQSVEVAAEASLVNTASATISTVVDSRRISDLPLNGRNLLQLTTVVPGVLQGSTTNFGHPFQPQGQVAVSSSGSGSNSINYSLDGGDNNYNYNLTANVYPNPDFVQEFSFQTNNFDPEFGRRGGGVVNVVTKSGNNQFHGTLFEYLRNQDLNARNFFATGGDGLKRNQYGGTVGGPVRFPHLYNGKDKTFFFFGYQGTPLRQVPNTLTATVLTAPERQGDFSQFVDSHGTPIIVYDPLTKAPFPGNQVPVSRFDPAAVKLFNYLPVATIADGLVRYQQPNPSNDGQWIGRIDQNAGSKDTFYFRTFFDNFNEPSQGTPGDVLTARWPPIAQTATNISSAWTHIFSPAVVNQSSFTFNRQRGGSTINTDAPTTQDLGIHITDVGGDRALIISDNGFSIALDGKVLLVSNNFNYRNTTTIVKGSHEIRFGADIVRLQFQIPRSTYLGDGAFSFGNSYTHSYLTDLLLGYPSSFRQSTGYAEAERETDWGFWAADRYKISRRLTLNLGLRYQPFLPYYDSFDNQNSRFIPGQQSKVNPNLPVGQVVYGDAGVPRRLTESSYNRFSPRLGLAWDPFGNGKTSVRAGYGIFYDAFPMDYFGQFSQEPPYSVSVALTNPGSFVDPYHGNDPFASAITFPAPKNYVYPTPYNVYGTAPGFREPVYQQWNLTIERQLFAPTMLASISYQGSHGTHLEREDNLNEPIYTPGASTVANEQQRRPYPSFTSIYIMRSDAFEDYDAFIATFEKRFSKGISVLASYTFSKSINETSGNSIQGFGASTNTDPRHPGIDRGLSNIDVPNRFVASYLWQLPGLTGHGAAVRAILGGWQHNGILTLQSGLPYSVTSGVDNSLTGIGQDRADLVGNPALGGNRSTASQLAEYFNIAAFAPNAIGTFGTSGRNILRGPGTANLDASLFKDIPIRKLRESAKLQFRFEFFNIFNTPAFANPTSNLSSPQFGEILSAGSPRIIQVSLRFQF